MYSKNLLNAVTAGLVSHSQLVAASRRILTHRFLLGLFDGEPHYTFDCLCVYFHASAFQCLADDPLLLSTDPRKTTYWGGKYNVSSTVHSPEHAAIAREAAQQGVVVVQNTGGVLPLTAKNTSTNANTDADANANANANAKSKAKTFALVGPLANVTDVFLGDYRPAACPGPAKSAPQVRFGPEFQPGTLAPLTSLWLMSLPGPQGTACLPTLFALLAERVAFSDSKVILAEGCGDQGDAGVPCGGGGGGGARLPVTLAVTAALAAADVIVLVVGEKTTDNDSVGNTGGEVSRDTREHSVCLS